MHSRSISGTVPGALAMAACGLALLLGGCRAAAPPPPPAPAVVDEGGRIEGLYRALAALESGQARAPVVMLQLGDSHTETDAFSGRMRALFQAKFGDGGRGPLPPGVPTRWYRPRQVEVGATAGWSMAGTRAGAPPGVFGLGGVTATALEPGAEMTLAASTPAGFDHAAIELLRQPGGGTLEARIDGAAHDIATAAASPAAAWHDLATPPGSRSLTLRARGDGPVSLLLWSTTRAAPGVVYANLGIVGATAAVLDRWDPAAVAVEAAALRPALLLVAFGTNEGFVASLDTTAYREAFARRIARLRTEMPGAAIVVIGPPDANQAPRQGRRKVVPRGCEPDAPTGRPVWSVPPMLGAVRAAQQDIAARHGWLFWDWAAAMGGACSMDAWVRADPPLAWPDHVHLRDAGYEATAEQLFAALMRGYAAYRAARPPA